MRGAILCVSPTEKRYINRQTRLLRQHIAGLGRPFQVKLSRRVIRQARSLAYLMLTDETTDETLVLRTDLRERC
jgi:hypothetical protein